MMKMTRGHHKSHPGLEKGEKGEAKGGVAMEDL